MKGVSRIALGELIETVSYRGHQENATGFLREGRYPVIDQGANDIAGYTNDTLPITSPLPLVVFGDHTRNVKFAHQPFVVGADGVKLLRPKDDRISPRYLYWLTVFAIKQIPSLGYSRHFSSLREVVVPVLDSPETRARVTSYLDLVQKIDDRLASLVSAKHEFKRGLMQQLLTGRRRFPEFSDSKWEKMPLGHFFVEKDVRNVGGSIEFVYSCSKLYGVIPQSERFKHRVASRDVSRYKVVEPGDLVYDPMLLWDSSIGFVPFPRVGVVSPAYATFSFREDRGDRSFFSYVLKSHRTEHLYRVISQGTNTRRRKAHPRDFLKIEIPVPTDMEEQARIGAFLANADREIKLLEQIKESVELQKRGLIQKLLTGELAVPASTPSKPEPSHV